MIYWKRKAFTITPVIWVDISDLINCNKHQVPFVGPNRMDYSMKVRSYFRDRQDSKEVSLH